MNYEQAYNCVPEDRRWIRWTNCLYLRRFRNTIQIRYGYRYRHSRLIATWSPNGQFKFESQYYYPSMRVKMNEFMPDGYQIVTHRYYAFLWQTKQDQDHARAFHIRPSIDHNVRAVPAQRKQWVIIKDGKMESRIYGETLTQVRFRLRKADIARDIPRRRGRYWLRKARGVYRRNICGKSYPHCEWKKMWPKPTVNWKGSCGCEVYTKKARSRDTVATIMAEENATVRTSKITIYGIEKFFNDAGAETINKEAGYELMTINTGVAHQEQVGRWQTREQTANVVLTALRMECSTTGKVYVNTVPPQIRTVRAGLDWMYDVQGYLDRIGVQT